MEVISSELLGPLAALGTASCWVITSIAFARAGVRVGSRVVNLTRLVFALPLLSALTWFLRGKGLPFDAGSEAWFWLSISGVLGFFLGDMCLFRAYVLIGPRLSSLVMATSPIFTALFGYWALSEGMGEWALAGMFLTLLGVLWALSDRRGRQANFQRSFLIKGTLLAILGAIGQGAGLIAAKHGMGEYDPFAATQIRILAAIVCWLLIFLITRSWNRLLVGARSKRAMAQIGLGALFGPVLGVGLSLVAVQHTNTGVAASIMSTTPILIIPVGILLFKEKVGASGYAGALLAIAGVALLFVS